MNSPRQDQIDAAIRDAGQWVETNDTVGGYMPKEQSPRAYQLLAGAFDDSQPLTHQPCEHLGRSGPQVAHWFTFWPQQAFCNACAVHRMTSHWPRRSPCIACRKPVKCGGEVTFGNVVVHGPMCTRCGRIENEETSS
jgi:hypothetical protein